MIRRRRMTRTFDPRPLPDGLLTSLLDTALRAPSAGFSQGTHLLVLQGDDLAAWWRDTVDPNWVERVAAGVGRAAAVVIVMADAAAYVQRYNQPDKAAARRHTTGDWPVPYWLTDAAMVVQNLLLLAEANGLGALYYGLFGDEAHLPARGVPAGLHPLGAVALGYRAERDQPSGSPTAISRRPSAEVIHIGRW